MPLLTFTSSFPWTRYSKKLMAKLDRLRYLGFFTKEESEARDLRLATAFSGKIQDGNALQLYWLVDKDDGIIVDAKFQAFGQSALLGASEIACELMIGKNYDQARRISADLIDKQVRDRTEIAAFPVETAPHLNLVLEAIEQAAEQCDDLPLPSAYIALPAPIDIGEVLEGGYPGWETLSDLQKIAIIEETLTRDIRPYIALDAGGVEVVSLNGNELFIAYQGSCTSCYSSMGTTLSYIQQTLRAKVHPSILVTPKL